MKEIIIIIILICVAIIAGWIIFGYFGLPFLVSAALTVLVSIVATYAIINKGK